MLDKLVKVDKKDRYNFIGVVDRIAFRHIKNKGMCPFVIMTNVKDEYGNHICNYAEFLMHKGFTNVYPVAGDVISFRARIVVCQKATDSMYGFLNPYTGVYYRLMNPTKVRKLINPVKSIRRE